MSVFASIPVDSLFSMLSKSSVRASKYTILYLKEPIVNVQKKNENVPSQLLLFFVRPAELLDWWRGRGRQNPIVFVGGKLSNIEIFIFGRVVTLTSLGGNRWTCAMTLESMPIHANASSGAVLQPPHLLYRFCTVPGLGRDEGRRWERVGGWYDLFEGSSFCLLCFLCHSLPMLICSLFG